MAKKLTKIRFVSLPGHPPAVQTGTLWRSIGHETGRDASGDWTGRVGTNVKYGFWLEVGTMNMEARPFLRPGLDRNRRKITTILTAPMVLK